MPKPRKPSKLTPLRTMRIFCEGEKTEPQYIKAYIRYCANDGRSTVVEIEKTDKNTAVQLVDQAIAAKGSRNTLPDDEFWVVYDRESPQKYSDELHAAALERAKKAGINVALTNVCFEYWLLLHFVDTAAPFSSFDDLIRSSRFRVEYKKAAGREYDKASSLAFDATRHSLEQARTRANQINRSVMQTAETGRTAPYQLNPYVGIIFLLDAIDVFR